MGKKRDRERVNPSMCNKYTLNIFYLIGGHGFVLSHVEPKIDKFPEFGGASTLTYESQMIPQITANWWPALAI